MKKLIILITVLCGCLTSMGTTVSNVRAAQRYPWNGTIDIDYTITGSVSNLLMAIHVRNNDSGVTYVVATNSTEMTEGENRKSAWLFGSAYDYNTGKTTYSPQLQTTNFSAKVTLYKRILPTHVIPTESYYVIDISSGPNALTYPVQVMNEMPAGGWTSEYKTSKIVLRRIHDVGTVTISGNGCVPVDKRTVSSPYYIGVFEITEAQFKLVMGNREHPVNGSELFNYSTSSTLPVQIYQSFIGGYERNQFHPNYNVFRMIYCSQSEIDSVNIGEQSFLGKLRAKTGLKFNLPTELQWEYACRALTESKFNNGGDLKQDMLLLGCCKQNSLNNSVTGVGNFQPNAWGLYDMHGNAPELCLGVYETSLASGYGQSNFGPNVVRGGTAGTDWEWCDSGTRLGGGDLGASGFRIACPAGL